MSTAGFRSQIPGRAADLVPFRASGSRNFYSYQQLNYAVLCKFNWCFYEQTDSILASETIREVSKFIDQDIITPKA